MVHRLIASPAGLDHSPLTTQMTTELSEKYAGFVRAKGCQGYPQGYQLIFEPFLNAIAVHGFAC